MEKIRCPYVPVDDALYVAYHDTEWCVPQHDDAKIYELFLLELFQAGLSWRTLLHKRENFRRAYAGFDVARVAAFTPEDEARLLQDAGIIRHAGKIRASIVNARVYQAKTSSAAARNSPARRASTPSSKPSASSTRTRPSASAMRAMD